MNRLAALRRRFIVVVMATITVMLLFIMLIIIAGNVQHYKNVAFESLHSLINFTNPVNTFSSDDPGAERFQDANRSDDQPLTVENADPGDTMPESDPPPSTSSRLDAEDQKAALALPGIVVALSEDGADAEVIFSRNMDTSDAEVIFSRNMDTSDATVQKLVSAVLSAAESEGTLAEYDLSYSMRQTPEGTKIAFVDRSYETSNIRSLLLWSLLGFVAAWLAFLFLVWRLSSWVFRPVEEAWSQQRQFIADASHELKTPLTVILANLRILGNHREDTIANQMRWIESSDQEALRMKKLVSDMLLLARNDADETQPLATEPVLFSDIVLGAILSFESVALDNSLRIHDEITPDIVVSGDKAQLEELVGILLDNACKYAAPESVISVRLTRQERSVHLAVHNKGDAFDDDAIAHLFERFYRLDQSRTRQTGGYGLGLAIADSICQRHQGHISAANEDEGVTFHVTLPIAQRERGRQHWK